MKTCERCLRNLPDTNFNKKCGSKRRLVDGGFNLHEYRDTVCRQCRRVERRACGICQCGKKVVAGRAYCEYCLEKMRILAIERRKRDRVAALQYYGGCCALCGESIEVFLTIDHVNNDGAKHRQHVRRNSKIQTGFDIGAWLRKNKYPDGFQVLCVNCNHAKGRIGIDTLIELLKQYNRYKPPSIG